MPRRALALCFALILGADVTCWHRLCLPGAVATASGQQTTHTPARDWKHHPAIVEVETTEIIFALGDVHGDYDRLITLLLAAKIVAVEPTTADQARWNAGRSLLVCTGDLIDKWDQSLKVITLLRTLQKDAAKAGGRVLVTMGNHEAEFLAFGGQHGKTADFAKELKVYGVDLESVTAGRDAAGVGQFPWWEKEGEEAAASQARLANYLKALGVKHLAIGHQPGKVRFADGTTRRAGELHQGLDGLLFLIDVGMSRGVGHSTGALLRIDGRNHDRASAVYPDGSARQLWHRP